MRADFEVRAGNTGTEQNDAGFVAVFKAGDPAEPLDLTGDEIVFVSRNMVDNGISLRKTSANGGVIVTPEEGRVVVPFTAAETRALFGSVKAATVKHVYEIERRRTSPVSERTILFGTITVLQGVNDD